MVLDEKSDEKLRLSMLESAKSVQINGLPTKRLFFYEPIYKAVIEKGISKNGH